MDNQKLFEKKLSSKVIYKGRILTFREDSVELPDGRTALREIVDHKAAVAIGALTEDDNMLFVQQYRYAVGEVLTEVPAGHMEDGENPIDAAFRELQEETGAQTDEFIDCGSFYPSPGCNHEDLRLFACRVTGFTETNPDEDEFLNCLQIPIEEAYQRCLNNEFPDGKTRVLVMKTYALYIQGKI